MGLKTRIERGFMWPADDTECAAVVFDTFKDDGIFAVQLCKRRRTVIQAGGNCGVWAIEFAKYFKQVVTAEPDALNYYCLSHNIKDKAGDIIALNVGFSDHHGSAGLDRIPGNAGAHQVTSGNDFVLCTIDAIAARDVDLIYLDIEGHELPALKGARETITRYKPMVVVEDKGLSERYGYKQGDVEKYMLDTHGYGVVARRNRDVFMIYPD